jgi:DNA polymerase IV
LSIEMIPGVGPKTHKVLGQKGIKTIGDLLQRNELAERYLDFDERAERRHRHDHSIGNETTLDKPLKQIARMEEVLWELIEEVGSRLRREKFHARCLTLKIRYSNFQTFTRSRTLSSPTCFDKEIFEVVSDLLRQNISRGRAVRLLGVSASALQTTGWQEPLLNRDKRNSFAALYKGIDELRRKYGEDAIGAATPRHKTG